jgi:DNA-binding NarL/FixJ family response regulator
LYERVIPWLKNERNFGDKAFRILEMFVAGKKPAEIAKALGITKNEVYVQKNRILGAVRERIRGLKRSGEKNNA